jgi:hypothetical protein
VRRSAAWVFAASVACLVVLPATNASSTAQQANTQCDGTFFHQRVDALFAALTSGNPARVAALFPNESTWTFHNDNAGHLVSKGGGLRIDPVGGVAEPLAAAVSAGDGRSIAELFPAAGTWQLEVVPTLKGFIRDGSMSRSSSSATRNGRALAALVEQFRGTRITWRAPSAQRNTATDLVSPKGTVFADQYVPGPLHWRVARYPSGSGHTVIRGAAKLALYCEGGVFGHVVMTPGHASAPT